MSQASDYMENELMDAFFGNTSSFGTLTSRPTLHICLCTVAVTDSMTGSTITEPTAGEYAEYARQQTANTDWNAAVAGVVDNLNAITFPKVLTGTGCTITHFAICDAASAGNLIAYGSLNVSMPIVVGSTPVFEAGDLDCSLD